MLVDILEEHVEEAEFLYSLRQVAMSSLAWDVADLADVDARLAAHLDGLLVGGKKGWELCQPLLSSASEGEAFVAAMLALANRVDEELAEVLPGAQDGTSAGIRRALCLSAHPGVGDWLAARLGDPREPVRAAALEALAFRRSEASAAADHALDSRDPELLRAGLLYAGRMRRRRALDRAVALVEEGDADVGAAALETVLLLDADAARACALELLAEVGPLAESGARVLGVVGRIDDRQVLQRAVEKGEAPVSRAALLAIGNLGAPELFPFLIELLADADRAPIAGAALWRMLGPDAPFALIEPPEPPTRLDDDDLPDEGDYQDDDLPEEASLLDDEEDDDEVWTPDSELPRYEAEPLSKWWADGSAEMALGTRYRSGKAFVPDAPRTGSALLFRHDEALEEALAAPDRPLRETRGSSVRLGADPDA